MPTLSIPGPTFARLAERAAALNITVEELAASLLDRLISADDRRVPRLADAWVGDLVVQYPPDLFLDDGR